MTYVIGLMLFLTTGVIDAQEKTGAIHFSPEIPDISMFQSVFEKIELQDKHYAPILKPTQDRWVGVVWGKTDAGKDKFWVAGFAQGQFTLQSGMFTQDDALYWGHIDLQELGVGEESIPVRVQIDVKQKLLVFDAANLTLRSAIKRDSVFNFTVQGLDEQDIHLADLQGKVVVLNWWTTSCAPCIEEMPGLNRLVESYGDQVVFLGVAWNKSDEVRR